MKYLILFVMSIVFLPHAYAQSKCTIDSVSGDKKCLDDNNSKVSYTYPSAATLVSEAKAEAQREQQQNLKRQQETLNNQALQEVEQNQIASDLKLSAQQATITNSLNALRTQSK